MTDETPKEDDEVIDQEQLVHLGYLHPRLIGDMWCALLPLSFHGAILCINCSIHGHDEEYFYPKLEVAMDALAQFEGAGDPLVGWIRHIPSNRRRKDGDPTKEEIRP